MRKGGLISYLVNHQDHFSALLKKRVPCEDSASFPRISVGEKNHMLIVNNEQRLLAGVPSLEEKCKYCGLAFAKYPLIQSDDANQTVYHAACALQFATEILVDLFTFFSPPVPYDQLFVLTTTQSASYS